MNKKDLIKMSKKALITFCATTALVTVSYAQQQGGGPGKGQPPKEAIEACQGQDEGSQCSVTTPRGDTLSGTCQNTPDKKYFACAPEHMKRKY